MKESFTNFLGSECGIFHDIKTLIYNLEPQQVEEAIQDYIKKYGKLELTEEEKEALNIYLDFKKK